MPCETALARRVRPQIGTLASLNMLLPAWGVKVPDVKAAVAGATKESLLFGEHTWGYCMEIVASSYGKAWEDAYAKGRYAIAEESWDEKGERIHKAARLSIQRRCGCPHTGPIGASRGEPGRGLQPLAVAPRLRGPRKTP